MKRKQKAIEKTPPGSLYAIVRENKTSKIVQLFCFRFRQMCAIPPYASKRAQPPSHSQHRMRCATQQMFRAARLVILCTTRAKIKGFAEADGSGDYSEESVESAEEGFKLPSYGSFALGSGLSQFPKMQKCMRGCTSTCLFHVLRLPYTERGTKLIIFLRFQRKQVNYTSTL